MTSILSTMERVGSTPISSRTSNRIVLLFIACLVGLVVFGAPLLAQTTTSSYSCFPTCSAVDGRFLTIAGSGFKTLVNSTIVLKIGSPGVATSIEIGLFDGETGGMWDRGTTKLRYYLYADPTGEGTGTTRVAEFRAEDMVDNGWSSFTVANVAGARSPNGNYLYTLVVTSSSGQDNYWSSFKVRTNGTIALKAQAFAVCATANTDQDLAVIYPNGVANIDSTTYDGTWRFFLDVPTAASAISVWDGDMDYGSYDCSVSDVDDLNTPNNVLPEWASNESATLEGIGAGTACVGTSGYSTGAPPDDSRYPQYRRSPAIQYDVVTPQGVVFTNSNPSGSAEWEEFRISTGVLDRNLNDAHADSIPAGIYELRVRGMDLANLNAWRISSDAIGVNEQGTAVAPVRAYSIGGNVGFGSATTTTVSSSGTTETTRRGRGNRRNGTTSTSGSSASETIANAVVTLQGDVNGDNVIDIRLTTTTDADGNYSFPNLSTGSYSVSVSYASLPAGSICIDDFDGTTTPNTASVGITSNCANPENVDFSYRISTSGTATGGTRTQGYWKTHASEWTCSSIRVGCTTYSREQAIAIMNTSVTGDETYSMFKQLVAAKLNVQGGSISTCIVATIADAEAWLCANPLGSNVGGSSSAWTLDGSALHTALDEYNNGNSCAPHVD